MKKLLLPLLLLLITQSQAQEKSIYHKGWIDFNKNGKMDVFEDPSQPIDKRIADLLSQMTVEEKTCQLATLYGYKRVLKEEMPAESWKNEVWKDGIANIDEELNNLTSKTDAAPTQYSYPYSKHADAINTIQKWFVEQTRMGIPVDFTNEGIHGLNHDRATSLPAPIAIGSTWDKALVREAGDIVGREAKALGYTNVYAPILDIARDPRWGRTLESYGEDPFLIAELGKQMVLGVQSQGVASTLKHFAVYSVPKGGRDGSARTDPHVAPRELFELYLYAFRRVIQEAHPMGVMSSYNDWDGVPITGSYYFLTELLRQKFGFDGYVVSDSDAVEYLFTKHHVAATYKDAVRQAIEAGLNVRTNFRPPEQFVLPLRELVREGAVPMSVLDSRVRDVLRVKMREGLFDHPYRPLKDPDSIVLNAEHVEVSKRASRESVVLLKNGGSLLPLDATRVKTIALSGPNADNRYYAMGRYGPGDVPTVTVRKALESRFACKVRIAYSPGADFFDEKFPETEVFHDPPTPKDQRLIDEAAANARRADIAIIVVGDQFNGVPGIRGTVGESASRASLDLSGRQDDLIRAVAAAGKPVIIVDISGRPVAL